MHYTVIRRKSAQRLINFHMQLRVIGLLLLIEAAFMIAPLIVGWYYGELTDIKAMGMAVAMTLVVGLLLIFGQRPNSSHMGKRDGFLLTALVWIVFSLFGMVPFIAGTSHLSVSDAFFEAMSGFTTTGATVIDPSLTHSHTLNLWRCLSQWIGGMGIILFTLALLPMFNSAGGVQMFNAEVTGITHDRLRPRVSSTAKQLWLIYILLTFILAVLLYLGPMSMFESICHALSTMSTGGFSTSPASISSWNTPYVKITLTIFMFIGGMNFALLYRACTQSPRVLASNHIFKCYIKVILTVTVIFIICLILGTHESSLLTLAIDPLFQTVSVITSTGYTVDNLSSWGFLVIAVILLLMFTGGCAGSTSGGAKLDRIIVLGKLLKSELYRCTHPNTIRPVVIDRKVVPSALVIKVASFLCLFVLLIVFGGIALSAMGVSVPEAFFSALSCVGNTGLDSGVAGIGETDFSLMPDAGKWLLSLLMLTGRLEIFTVLILFMPSFWQRS